MSYRPEPIDTTCVASAPGIAALPELRAQNTHENWAKRRMAKGWRHDATGGVKKRECPGLAPCKELPETDRGCDRKTAMETVNKIQALGYRIPPAANREQQ